MDEPGEARAPRPDRHLEGVEGELGAEARDDPPADDRPAEGVDDERRVHEARPGPDVGQVGDPQAVRGRRREHPLDEVGRALLDERRPWSSGHAWCGSRPARPSARISRPTWSRPTAMPSRRRACHTLRAPYTAEVGPVDAVDDPRPSSASRTGPGRRWPDLGRVVGGRGDRQGPADRLDPERAAVLVDEAGHRVERRSSSAPKKVAALLRISLARRSSRFSRSSSLMRSRSSVVRPGARAGVDLGLVDPVADRLGADAQLVGDLAHRAVALTLLGDRLVDQPDGPLLQLRWIPPLDPGARVRSFCHGSIFLQGMEPPSNPVRFTPLQPARGPVGDRDVREPAVVRCPYPCRRAALAPGRGHRGRRRSRKPNGEGYASALRQLGVDARRAAVFEDTSLGIAAAHAAGVACIVRVGTGDPVPPGDGRGS